MIDSVPYWSKLQLPVVAAPMFLISGPSLVVECCKNGIVGTFPALNNRSTGGLDQWLDNIGKDLNEFEQKTGRAVPPFGVNLIVHRSNPRLGEDLAVCIKHRVPLIITSLGAVSSLVDRVHDYGGLVYHDVIHARHGRKAAEAGVDGLIGVATGAGGHAGTLSPIVLVNELRKFFNGTILLAGCLSTGKDIATALQMGADLAYMGTRFINTFESEAEEDYRTMIQDADSSDIVYTAAVSGVHGNFLSPSLERAGLTGERLSRKARIDFGTELSIDAHEKKPKAWKNIWSAGQGVSSIDETLSVAHLVRKLKIEYKQALKEQSNRLDELVGQKDNF